VSSVVCSHRIGFPNIKNVDDVMPVSAGMKRKSEERLDAALRRFDEEEERLLDAAIHREDEEMKDDEAIRILEEGALCGLAPLAPETQAPHPLSHNITHVSS
jgi:hypothetical protein